MGVSVSQPGPWGSCSPSKGVKGSRGLVKKDLPQEWVVEQRDLRVLVRVCFSVSCGAGWEAGLESGTTEAAKSCVVSCIPGQSWAVGCAVHALPRTGAWAARALLGNLGWGLPNEKPSQDWSQSASL